MTVETNSADLLRSGEGVENSLQIGYRVLAAALRVPTPLDRAITDTLALYAAGAKGAGAAAGFKISLVPLNNVMGVSHGGP